MKETRKSCWLLRSEGVTVVNLCVQTDGCMIFIFKTSTDSRETRGGDNWNLWKCESRCSSLHWSDVEDRADWEDGVLYFPFFAETEENNERKRS